MDFEKLVKEVAKSPPSTKELNFKFSELETALDYAPESAQSLGVYAEESIEQIAVQDFADIPSELSHDIAKRVCDAAEMGDVTTLNTVAEEIKTQSDSCVPISKRIVQMEEDFQFDGILELADDLGQC